MDTNNEAIEYLEKEIEKLGKHQGCNNWEEILGKREAERILRIIVKQLKPETKEPNKNQYI